MTNKFNVLASSCLLAGFLVACGGSSSSDSSGGGNSSLETGRFVDAPVKGLHYETATQNGYTNEKGEFKYKAGEEVEFKLGKDLSLGKVTAGGLITPYTMANVAVGTDDNKATNIALLLQNLDNDRSDGFLDVSKLEDVSLKNDFDLSVAPTTMENEISTKLNDSAFTDKYIEEANPSVITVAKAKADMKKFVELAQKEQDKKKDISNLLNKQYAVIECNELFGCKSTITLSFTDETTIKGQDEGEKFTGNGEKQDNGDLKLVWDDEDGIEYLRILNVSDKMLSICWYSGNEPRCNTTEEWWVVSSIKDEFLKTKQKSMNLLPKEKVTKFSEIQNKNLW